jgi:branched-chain amino acid aminotransferase
MVPADDRGFLLGDGLFETVRLYRGRPFRLEAHLRRMEEGARRVGIPVPGDLRERAARAVEQWGERDGGLRITLTRAGGAGLAPDDAARPFLAIQVRPLRPDPRSRNEGLSAHVVGAVARDALTAGLKALGYLERIQALRVARERGGDEALLTDGSGRLVDGSASNLLVVDGRTLLAPGPGEGALAGITRAAVLGVLARDGFRVEERGVPRSALGDAAEVFLTSSLREVAPVVSVDGRPIGDGRPGPVFRRALAALGDVVADELGVRP